MSSGPAELLVRLDTSALESRLNGLTDQWEGPLRGMRTKVDDCSAGVRAVSADVAAIQRFLLSYHNREMLSALSATGNDSSGERSADAPVDPLEECATPSTDATATENLLKTVTIARRLLADNEALRTSLDNATAALVSFNTTQESLKQEVTRLRELTTTQSERLQNMSDWLGMSGLPMNMGAADDNKAGEASGQPGGPPGASADGLSKSTEAVLARSPLLLSFRRFLLRDLTERLVSVVDQQSKDFHDSIAHLEGRIQSGQCVVTSGDPQHGGDSNGNLLETVRTLSKQVKELEQQGIKRDEFTSLMRSKADSLLLPVKADSAAVSEMERRLATRCGDLEERCAYADSERAEFRAILRSLIAAQTAAINASVSSGPTSADQAAPTAAADGSPQLAGQTPAAILRDLLPALTRGPSAAVLGRQKSQSFHSARGAPPSSSLSSPSLPPPRQQQLYRVVGASQGLGVQGVPVPLPTGAGAALYEAAAPPASTSGTRVDATRSQSTPSKGDEEAAVAIGMTASQGDYASYVSQQLNRKLVASLPTLPYERMANSQ
ncbi:hypothetical protein ABB37_02411 [Leptomonas pyrrhocoris]|uniref:Uncharacterized protein n=1 Tax=Leptomonas pyrrhocoris TaxID=157538 RepID=A0A0M9G7Z2_LEPPY|nr:hypothetical protein ABB37_02411 [Leptomonas pyrrhocoris]XP_015662882.1 hypothetical protein ABB37_02411 [Leptomonas pyrrhocoris]XP_015662883.1 hypothetical protein ABB37_02411 [Leptomonas pyrrhocoris]KPA84442.1 hypothetical protein ABB37_02411 [Leptomonas pyrrhocoris]KPA84443.1 hypothetical protein ABB37_02411 [Leptomonas pyrrhocoris]KPA84444.1 hypothetical protein ABB37_02411 [Leptomonas pyrrhocoris]|eukprot:XP_015662881.1 hypothetical protein ABB37_02411 [Leptomonas pyrrhocoris]